MYLNTVRSTGMMIDECFSDRLKKLKTGISILPDKGEESVEGTLRALWLAAAGRPESLPIALNAELPALNDKECEKLEEFIAERQAGKPLAYITGRQRFMGLDFIVTPAALIPRKETELLATVTIEKIDASCRGGETLKLVDVCTGMGNLAITFASLFESLEILACDLSVDALELARKNANRLGVADRILFADGDLLDPFDEPPHHGTVDFLICNPPYITSTKVKEMPVEISSYEPEMAFDGGAFGINFIQRLIHQSAHFLKIGGWLIFEVGAGQGNLLLKRMKRSGTFSELDYETDESGMIRVLLAKK